MSTLLLGRLDGAISYVHGPSQFSVRNKGELRAAASATLPAPRAGDQDVDGVRPLSFPCSECNWFGVNAIAPSVWACLEDDDTRCVTGLLVLQ